ncbi:hypothetical protein HHE02_11790 [Helicobacter heilmannii]|nr:hypothetical protein HHE02_11790 [Helicobacter heilmannii]
MYFTPTIPHKPHTPINHSFSLSTPNLAPYDPLKPFKRYLCFNALLYSLQTTAKTPPNSPALPKTAITSNQHK